MAISLKNVWEAKQVIEGLISARTFPQRMRQFCSKTSANIFLEDEEYEKAQREKDIEKARNRSGLQDYHYNMMHNIAPYDEKTLSEKSLKVKRMMYGRFGDSSKVNKSVLWPSKEELGALKEYEAIAHPLTVKELIAQVEEKKRNEEEERRERELKVMENIRLNKKKIFEFNERVRRKHLEALAAIEKRNKLIQQVRINVGYDIDTKSDRFKEELAKLEEREAKLKLEKKKESRLRKKSLAKT